MADHNGHIINDCSPTVNDGYIIIMPVNDGKLLLIQCTVGKTLGHPGKKLNVFNDG